VETGPSEAFSVHLSSAVGAALGAATLTVMIADNDPRMAVDVPAGNATVHRTFTVAGWAVDLLAPSGPGVDVVHVWAYPNPGSGADPIFGGAATYGGSRPDVGRGLWESVHAFVVLRGGDGA
jgi:hypothetical protein